LSNRIFTSWVRRGASAAITEQDPVAGPWPGPATFNPSVVLRKDGAVLPAIAGPALALVGPGAITGLNQKSILRTDPRDGATGVEDNYLVQIEFNRADLPWMFTPSAPGANNRLRPWLVLIVVDAATVQLQPGTPLPRVSVPLAQLPDLNDSWGWAHSQVTVDDPANAPAELVPASGNSAISRLICPRRLEPDKAYLACVVPATLPGVQAGLGQPPDPGPAIPQAWTIGGAADEVILPVYYSWRFSTGDDGDFKSLVGRLRGVRPTDVPNFGMRTVDMSSPWQRGDQLPAGTTFGLGGALGTGLNHPPSAAAPALFEPRLTRLLNFPADLLPAGSHEDPTLSAVAPPIYAARHAGATRVPVTPSWLRTLNLDPRRRVAASFGTTWVQENQEFLMAKAWDQLGAVQEANRLQALAELAGEVGDRMHRRHIAGLDLSRMVAIAAPARTRVLLTQPAGPALTLHATTAASPIPTGATTVAFNRLARAQGPLGRRTFNRVAPAVVKLGFTGQLKSSPVFQDGISALAQAPARPAVLPDPTSGLVLRAWSQVTTIEKAIPAPNVTALIQATNLVARAPSPNPKGIKFTQLPVLRILPVFSPPKPVDAVAKLTSALAISLTPSSGIARRYQGRVQLPPGLVVPGRGAGSIPRVMACPQFPAPLAMSVKNSHQDWLLPGLGNFPDNRVTLLEADGAFVESFLAGVNHEMNREFLWRGYPTDQRGTPFRHFWPRADRAPDVPPITSWPLNSALGSNGSKNGGNVENLVVLLVRGELLHRYPRSIVMAAPAISVGGAVKLDPGRPWTAPDFALRLDDRTTAFAYNLTLADIRSGNGKPGYYFVFSEPITGPRFNFDASPAPSLKIWSDVDWARVPQSRGFAIAGLPLAPPLDPQGASWNRDAADVARIAFAIPFRVAYHADELLAAPDA